MPARDAPRDDGSVDSDDRTPSASARRQPTVPMIGSWLNPPGFGSLSTQERRTAMTQRRFPSGAASLAITLLLLLPACARMMPTPPPSDTRVAKPKPAPAVTVEPAVPSPAPQAELPDTAVVPPKKPAPPPSPPAVLALMDEAEAAGKAGQWDTSAATLERAIRINPRNPTLWHQLAKTRLQQGQFQSAEDLAKKSNVFAAGDRLLVKQNWRLIAEARRQKGDTEGAKDAEAKANR